MNNDTNSDIDNVNIDNVDIIDLEYEDDGIEIIDPDSENTPQPEGDPHPVYTNSTADKTTPKDSRRSSIIRGIIMAVSALIFLFSAGMLIHIFMDYNKADNIYNDVENSVFTPVQPVQTSTTAADPDNTSSTIAPQATEGQEAVFKYNHDALLAINSDSVGYMVIPALNLSLPVVQGSDNDFYLTHAVTGEYSGNGTLFIDYRIGDALEASNAIIYGHCMKNGSMFGSLYKLKNTNFLNSGSNDTFYIYTGNQIYTYKIYSVHETPAISSTYTIEFADDASFLAYTTDMAAQSLTPKDVPINAGDKTITLSTCTNDDDVRLVVHAVRIGISDQE